MARAVALAWESFCAGSLGIGAVVTRGTDVVATGRNRLAETDPGDDLLAGTSLAHAEINALAKLPWGSDPAGLELWTTLQPCLQCIGAIRLSPVGMVHVLAPDPLFRGVERARDLNPFIASKWPEILQHEVEEWSVLSLLLQTHVAAFWQVTVPGWNEALPSIAGLAAELVGTGELLDLVAQQAEVSDVVSVLGPRLRTCVAEVARLVSVDPC